jgi:hypothetical protein
MNTLVERMDEYGKGAWIALMVVSFVVFWPLGLAILGYMIWSGRMGCRAKSKVAAFNSGKFGMGRCGPGRWHRGGGFPSSGNRAFDDYREETLNRLQEEHEEFQSFMEKLRHARDKAEFDQFMADRARNEDVTDVEDETGKDEKPVA